MATLGDLVVRIVGDNSQLDKSIDQSEKRLKDFGKAAEDVGKKLTTFVTLPILGLGTAAIKTAADFEQSMLSVQAISGATGRQLEELSAAARKFGATTQFSASEAASAMEFLAMAGFDVNKIMSAMPSVLSLAAASNVDLGASADIVTNIMSGFNLTSEELSRTVDVLTKQFTSSNTDLRQLGSAFRFVGPVAQAFNVSIEQTSAALGILSDAGIQGSAAGTGLRRVLSTLAESAEKLGIETLTAEGNMRPLDKIIGDLEVKGLSAADSMAIFGERGGPALQVLLSRGSAALAEMTASLQNVDGLAASIAETRMQGLNGQLRQLKSVAQEFAITIGNDLAPMIKDIVSKLTDFTRSLTELDAKQRGVILTVAGVAAAIGPLIFLVGKSIAIFTALKAAVIALNVAMAANPVLAIVAGLSALVAVSAIVISSTGLLRDANKRYADQLREATDAVKELSLEEQKRARAALIQEQVRLQEQLTTATEEARKAQEAWEASRAGASSGASWTGSRGGAYGLAGVQERARLASVEVDKLSQRSGILGSAIDELNASIGELEAFEAREKALIDQAEADRQAAAAAAAYAQELANRQIATEALTQAEEERTESQLENEAELFKALTKKEEFRDRAAEGYERKLAREAEAEAERVKLAQEAADAQLEIVRAQLRGEESEYLDFEAAMAAAQERITAKEAAELQARKDLWANYAETVKSIAIDIAGALGSLWSALGDRERSEVEATYAARRSAAEATIEDAAELAEAITEINKAEAAELRKIKRQEAKEQKLLGAFNVFISTAEAIMKFLARGNVPLSIAAGVAGALQLAAVLARPLPALAQGGIVPATPGGQPVIAGEGGSPEAVVPLDQIGRFISDINRAGGGGGDMRVIVNLDGQPIIDTVARASRARTLLIDSRSVVTA
jgi:TP901 family phage tail tape measure protein